LGKIPTRSKLIILTAVMASLLEIIDTSIVNVAVPTMMGNLGSTLDEISWVVTGYIIANAIVLPISSWMSEQLGRKFYYTGCIVLFTAASVACGLAPNLPLLVLFRVIQGFAGGALLPTSQAMIYESFPREQAGMASAIYGMSVMVGPTVGPTLGGYLTDNFGWRSIFNINLPLGIIVMMLSWFLVEDVAEPGAVKAESTEPRKRVGLREHLKTRKRNPIDSIGLGLLVVGIGCAQFVLERGHAEDWFDSKAILICTVLAVVSLVSLIPWELRTEHPILQLRHFKNVTFRSGVALMFSLGCMLYGLIFLIPVFVSTIQGLTATQTGELFIPGALAGAMMMPIIGVQLQKRDPRLLVAIGIVLLGAAVFNVSRFDSQTSVAGMFWPLMIRGAAMGFMFVPINSVVLSQFTGVAIGQAAGLLNLCRQIGGSVAIAILSTVFQQHQVRTAAAMGAHLTPFDPIARQMLHGVGGSLQGKLPNEIGLGSPHWGNSNSALQILSYRVHKEAFVLSFQHVMLLAVSFFLLALIPMLTMRRGNMPVKAEAAH
jgi:DHA2 family multidrug resistance protein